VITLALALVLAQPCVAAGPWCDADVPCRVVSRERDPGGIERVEIEEDVPGALPAGRAAALWLVYPGFDPFPAAVGAFRYEVGTPRGTFGLCLLPSVAARQRRATGPPLEGGLALLTFDPSRSQPPRFPLDGAFDTARREGLLTPAQLRSLGELDRIAGGRADDLGRAWRELAQSPYLAWSRRQLLDRIRGFDDPRPVGSKDDLRPQRFFDREQRTALRRRGHDIPGTCSLLFLPRSARVELAACPLSQLAAAWNRRSADAGTLPNLRAAPERKDEEIDGVTLELNDVAPATAARLVFGLLSAVDGLSTGGEAPAP
jgi:hypothetical protein